jgi:hypothetical protein
MRTSPGGRRAARARREARWYWAGVTTVFVERLLKTTQRLQLDLARRQETEYPSAAESVREGLTKR